MYGAIIGDISGSPYEFDLTRMKDYNYNFFEPCGRVTDDSVMTCAVASALLKYDKEPTKPLEETVIEEMRRFGRIYRNAGYGGMFQSWLFSERPEPYNSFGNGSAMRISPVGWFAKTRGEVKELSYKVTAVTHNHPEGLKGAEAVAMCIFLARHGIPKEDIRKCVERDYYRLNFTLDEIRPEYNFQVSCQESVPQAIEAFLESDCFESAVRLAVSLGGDSDTQGAITGSIAEAYYGIPDNLIQQAQPYTHDILLSVIDEFRGKYIRGNYGRR